MINFSRKNRKLTLKLKKLLLPNIVCAQQSRAYFIVIIIFRRTVVVKSKSWYTPFWAFELI